MKKKKRWIIIPIVIVIIIGLIVGLILLLNDKNKLTVEERSWVDDNINKVLNINVVNDALVFSKDGTGVFYDFLKDFEDEYDLKFNPITYVSTADAPAGISFDYKTEVTDNDLVFYKDHYVLIGKQEENITDLRNITDKKIGVLNSDFEYLTANIKNFNVTYDQYESIDALYEALSTDHDYKLLQSTNRVVYHFSDVKTYYVMQKTDDYLSSILEKYYNVWNEQFEDYFSKSEFNLFAKSLGISEIEIDKLQSKSYKYGFVNNSPYEIIIGGSYGGIIGVYLHHFSSFSDIDFSFNKYRNYDKFTKAINNKKIDLYFAYYNNEDDYLSTTGPKITYAIASRRNNPTVIDSIYSLKGEEVYVEQNSVLHNYANSLDLFKVKTYKNNKELKKLNKKDVFILLDKNILDYYVNNKLDNYVERTNENVNINYHFKVRDNEKLANLLDRYINTLDQKEITNLGLENHYETVKSGTILSTIAKYIIYLIVISALIVLLVIKKGKKVTIAKKIKKDDKLRFIDQLTSLKNRNYLNENIASWNNNTIYPQTVVVIDLNRVQEINDLNGYEEGDKQIMAAANALIKTQLDNSEIMRTDGNEFVAYLVGYSQKQVTNYIHKLNKELNKLPYNYGAEYGYSMINDNIKTIEDAMNEAVLDLKKQKEKKDNEKKDKK